MAKVTMQQILNDLNDLPALPDVAVKIIRATADPKIGAQRLARIIATDQAFTARVLRIANSAYYGLSRRIGTVTEAVVLLGTNRLRALALAAATYDMLNREYPGYALHRGEMWRHSMGTAITAQLVAKTAHLGGIENAFIAGLLHDVGKCVLDAYVGSNLPELLDVVGGDKVPFLEAEREVIGFDHAELGGMCAQKWQLPADLVDAIRYHHEPGKAAEMSDLLAVAHIADALCMSLGIGLGGDGLRYRLDDNTLRHIGVTHADLMVVMSEVVHTISSTRPLFDLDSVALEADVQRHRVA
jgi:putative nucleotidyltransferase with HDIG domain